MATTATATYYAPSTSENTVTTWLPLTTIYPNHGNCASNYWLNGNNEFWAWLPDCPIHTFGTPCLPPVVTLSYLASLSFVPNDVYSIGPFLGCPVSYTPVTTSTISGSSSLTICCPTSYEMISLTNGDVRCLSTAADFSIISAMLSSGSSATTTISPDTDTETTATVTAYTSWMAEATLEAGQGVTAYPISGWNIAAASDTASAAASNGTCDDSPAISTGVIAGLAVLAVWAVGGTVAAVVAGILLRKTRSRRRALGPKYEAAPGFAPESGEHREQSAVYAAHPQETHEMVGRPLSEMTEGRAQRMELPGN